MTKIDLITGILGSGKTTFLLRYARYLLDSGQRIAILVNDYGAVNVDMLMLQELKCPNCQLEMIAGTSDPCCHKRRFKTQLISLGMQHFDRVIVEPSGIFDMDEFFDILHESPLDNWFTIGSIIGILDSETDDTLTGQMEYLLASEAACCGKLVVSKIKAGDDTSEITEKLLARLNNALDDIKCDRNFSEKDVISCEWSELDENTLRTLSDAGYRSSRYVKKYHPEDILSSVHYFMHIKLPDEKIEAVISSIMNDNGCGKIFRIKGSLHSDSKGWLKINATPLKTEITPVIDGQSVLIVIGDNINRENIDEHITQFNSDSEYVSI